MAAPVYTLPTTGSSPKYATKGGHEAAINAAMTALFALLDAADDALSDRISAITEGFVAAGEWDASGGTFPSGTQTLGTFYLVTTAGTVDGVAFAVGDQLLPLVTNPSTTTYSGNWARNPRSELISTVFDDAPALFGSSEATRGVGGLWEERTGTKFTEVASGGDATKTGGIELQIADDSTSANAVGADDSTDPDGREAFAPALVTSMTRRKLYGVTLRDLLGRNYAGTLDGAAALNGFLPELAPEGISIHDPHNLKVLLGEPLRPESEMKLALGPSTTMMRGYVDTGADTGALVSRADWTVDTDDWEISGGIWTTASPSQTGKLFNVYGSRWKFTNAVFLEWYGASCFTFGGDDFLVQNVMAFTNSATSGNDAFRMIGGKRGRAIGLRAKTYDDAFAIGTISNNTNARFDLDIEDFYYIGCTGISAGARVCAAFVGGPQTANDMTATLKKSGYIGIGGVGGNRCISVTNGDGDGTIQRQIDDIVLRDISIDASQQIVSEISNSIYLQSRFTGGIGRIVLDNVVLTGNDRQYGLYVDEVTEVTARDCQVTGEASAAAIIAASFVTVDGGRYGVEDNGGGGTPSWAFEVGASSSDVQLEISGHTRFFGVASSVAAVRLSSSTAIARLGNIDVVRASGATSVIGVSYAAGSAVDLGIVTGDFDTAASGSGYLTHRGVGSVSATQLADATHPVNTFDKAVNKVVFETTNDRFYRATGPDPTDPWNASDGAGGTGNVTPS